MIIIIKNNQNLMLNFMNIHSRLSYHALSTFLETCFRKSLFLNMLFFLLQLWKLKFTAICWCFLWKLFWKFYKFPRRTPPVSCNLQFSRGCFSWKFTKFFEQLFSQIAEISICRGILAHLKIWDAAFSKHS